MGITININSKDSAEILLKDIPKGTYFIFKNDIDKNSPHICIKINSTHREQIKFVSLSTGQLFPGEKYSLVYILDGKMDLTIRK